MERDEKLARDFFVALLLQELFQNALFLPRQKRGDFLYFFQGAARLSLKIFLARKNRFKAADQFLFAGHLADVALYAGGRGLHYVTGGVIH